MFNVFKFSLSFSLWCWKFLALCLICAGIFLIPSSYVNSFGQSEFVVFYLVLKNNVVSLCNKSLYLLRVEHFMSTNRYYKQTKYSVNKLGTVYGG